MSIAVIIPWRPGCPHRQRALEWVTTRLVAEHPDWPVVIGAHLAGDWCKAAAVANGLAQTDADTLIIHDADVWVPNLTEAVERCTTWATPHLMVHRLTEPSTDTLLATGTPGGELVRRPYRGFLGGGVTVVTRDVYDDCPIDHRFTGWGQEDAAWALALDCLYGPPWRGDAVLLHLWHPPQPRIRFGIGSEASSDLFRRYSDARRHPDLMRALIAESHGGGSDEEPEGEVELERCVAAPQV